MKPFSPCEMRVIEVGEASALARLIVEVAPYDHHILTIDQWAALRFFEGVDTSSFPFEGKISVFVDPLHYVPCRALGGGRVTMRITIFVRDRDAPHRSMPVRSEAVIETSLYSQGRERAEEIFLLALRSTIMDTIAHELDECLLIRRGDKLERPFDPHKRDRVRSGA